MNTRKAGGGCSDYRYSEAHRNPYFNMVTVDNQGFAELSYFSHRLNIFRRQDAPNIFDVTTVCYVVQDRSLCNSVCWHL